MHVTAFSSDITTILAFGDSLTAGWGLRPGEAYPEQLAILLKEKGYKVRIINAGVSGDTTAGGLSRLGWALRNKPDITILALGANDGLRGLSTRLMDANLDSMLKRLKRDDVPVLLCGMYAPQNLDVGYESQFNAVYPRLAEKYGVEFYPFILEGVAGNASLNLPDGIHPNAEGARIIAENLVPVMEKMIKAHLAEQKSEDQ